MLIKHEGLKYWQRNKDKTWVEAYCYKPKMFIFLFRYMHIVLKVFFISNKGSYDMVMPLFRQPKNVTKFKI